MQDGFDMPAMLPDAATCSKGPQGCKPVIHRRNDDTEEVIAKRLQEYDIKTAPIVDYYRSRNELVTFHVRKGVKDSPQLLQLILSASAAGAATTAAST
jgi:adenylate kinase